MSGNGALLSRMSSEERQEFLFGCECERLDLQDWLREQGIAPR